jgi:hypothetical protein
MSEVINLYEGSLVWVQASGHPTAAWQTASAPPSGVMGFVESMTLTSARTIATQMERGRPRHHKVQSKEAPELQITYRWTGYGITGTLTASGATMPMVNFEYRGSQTNLGAAPTGRYFQMWGAALVTRTFTEGAEFNQAQETWRLLGFSGENNSGYMGNHTT